jgi:predicted RNA-binding protein YlqC (UPF0109 family)
MIKLVEDIARTLVDYPDDIHVTAAGGSEVTVFELRRQSERLRQDNEC